MRGREINLAQVRYLPLLANVNPEHRGVLDVRAEHAVPISQQHNQDHQQRIDTKEEETTSDGDRQDALLRAVESGTPPSGLSPSTTQRDDATNMKGCREVTRTRYTVAPALENFYELSC